MAQFINIHPEPAFERIRGTLLLQEKPDRPPLANFGVAENIAERVVGRKLHKTEYRAGPKTYDFFCTPEEWVEFWFKSGYDYVEIRPFFKFAVKDIKGKEGAQSSEGYGVIQTMEDLHSQSWPWQKEEDWCFDHIVATARAMPSEMKLIISTHDIFISTWENMGFMHFCNSIYESPDLIAEVFRQIGEAVYKINLRTAELVGNKIGALWYQDDIAFNTGMFVNPEVFRQHLFPWMEKIGNVARELNVPFLYHSDGSLWDVFDDFYNLGVNAIHPLEPKSMVAEEVKEKEGHRFCLVGNIDLDMLSRGTPEETRTMVLDRVEKLGYNGGYCVGTSNTVPHYVDPLNYRAMVETVFEYGR